jgi:hypothetical protein
MHSPKNAARTLASRLAPLALAVVALPLLAPTCGPVTPGVKAFSKGSLIIPMDACYQGASGTTPAAGCPSAGGTTRDLGDIVKAYGLVYQLIKNDVPVYWIIEPGKTALTGTDLTLQLNGGQPAAVYDWASGTAGGPPPNNTGSVINYLGGPFVVDGSDWARVQQLFQQGNAATGTPALRTAFSAVKVHRTQVAFQGFAAKTFAGGWGAGGSVAPKLALLNIPGGDGRYADHVLEGYLIRAGLAPACAIANPPCADPAGGTATDTGHGTIYDRLEVADFLPAACTANPAGGACPAGGTCCPAGSTCDVLAGKCDWRSTNVHRYGYRVLWLPHWTATNSCTGSLGDGFVCGAAGGCSYAGGDQCSCVACSPGPAATSGQIADVLATLGAFVGAGNDLFGECGGIGSLEGIFGGANGTGSTTVNTTFGAGNPASRFMTSGTGAFPLGGGLHYNETPATGSTAFNAAYFSSPFLQIGDFPYSPASGLIDKYRPATAAGSTWKPNTIHLVYGQRNGTADDANRLDYFTLLPATDAAAGNVVYLAGHDYSGFQGSFQIAGSRMVLNTLFNLGAACVETFAACSTGKLGQCAIGEMRCVGSVPTCVQKFQPVPETCNGLDDDCNGAVDDLPPVSFYTGPAGTSGVGLCHGGVKSCVFSGTPGTEVPLTVTAPEVTPQPEICNGLDDDCDGQVDDGIGSRACYEAGGTGCTPRGDGTFDCKGACRTGTQSCQNGSWTACQGDVGPAPELCEPATDTNCNGVVGDGCGCYPPGLTRSCYTGAAGTENVGACRAGSQACGADGTWGGCQGDVVPGARGCSGDRDCDGVPDDQQACCAGGQPVERQDCYTGPAGTRDVGVCRGGGRVCENGAFGPACEGQVLPSAELCNGLDDDCNGVVDDGALCSAGTACVNGACVPTSCGALEPPFCPEGYTCVVPAGSSQGTCRAVSCGAAPCPAGQKCVAGACVDPCAGVSCAAGAFCSGGLCTGGGCYARGCAAGEICVQGECRADPCAGATCPAGTFCRGGVCAQSCAFTSCRAGERCGPDGFCIVDPCLSLTCGAGKVCAVESGTPSCVADPCAGKSCGQGQLCSGGQCVSDPCAGIVCPVGSCASGQCFSAANPGGIGSDPPPAAPSSNGGGCGQPTDGFLALLLAGSALPALRRRRGPAAAGPEAGRSPPRRPSRAPGAGGAALAALLAVLALAGCGKSETPAPAFPCVTQCGSTCTDLSADPTNCGACGTGCTTGQICVDGHCGPGSAVAPFVASLSPASVASGSAATVQVSGQRFQSGAQVLITGTSAPATTRFVDAGRLDVQVDASAAGPSRGEIRVLNPDRVISNAAVFEVTFPSPQVSSIAPSEGVTHVGDAPGAPAATLDVTVTGTGFASVSQCHLAGPGHADEGLVSALAGGALRCTLDLRTLQPGVYDLWVVNAGQVASNKVTFTVLTTDPVLDSISPAGGQAGRVTSITCNGSGFDATSVVRLDGQPVGHTTFVSGTRLVASPVDLAAVPVGVHAVSVANGAKVSGARDFTVSDAPPVALGISPGTARQGATVTVTVSGTGFGSAPRLHVVEPGGTARDVTPTSSSPTQVSGSYTFAAAGEYQWTVVNSAGSSDALPFRALSNVAILAGLSPATAPQGTTAALTLTVQNLEAGARTWLAGGGRDGEIAATVSLPSTVTASLPLAGWDTGTYALTVVNPGAAPSNALGLSVTPGAPELTGVCAGTGCTPGASACVVQGPVPVRVFLAGANFAKPGAGGGGGSAIHAASEGCTATPPVCPVPDAVLPGASVTVVDAQNIAADFDTASAIPGTYDVTVWNPGPSGVVRSAARKLTVRASGACP